MNLPLNPLVLQCLLGSHSFFDVAFHESAYEVFHVVGAFPPQIRVQVVRAILYFLQNFTVSSAVEWRLSRKHDVQNDADGPQIAYLSVFAFENLGRDVVCGAVQLVHLWVLSVEPMRCAEIYHFYRAPSFRIDQNVFWFEVSVCDLLLVAVGDRAEYLLGDNGRLQF